MVDQRIFTNYLDDINPTFKQLWYNLLQKQLKPNQYIHVESLGYIFKYQQQLIFILNDYYLSDFLIDQGKQIFQYLRRLLRVSSNRNFNSQRYLFLLQYLLNFIQKSTKKKSGHPIDVYLNINPLGILHFKSNKVAFKQNNLKWKVHKKIVNIQKLPKLQMTQTQQRIRFSVQTKQIANMQRKFSLSLRKEDKSFERKTLKRIQSSKNILSNQKMADNSTKNNIYEQKPLIQNKSLIKKHIEKQMGLKNNRQNRILRLKTQKSNADKNFVQKIQNIKKQTKLDSNAQKISRNYSWDIQKLKSYYKQNKDKDIKIKRTQRASSQQSFQRPSTPKVNRFELKQSSKNLSFANKSLLEAKDRRSTQKSKSKFASKIQSKTINNKILKPKLELKLNLKLNQRKQNPIKQKLQILPHLQQNDLLSCVNKTQPSQVYVLNKNYQFELKRNIHENSLKTQTIQQKYISSAHLRYEKSNLITDKYNSQQNNQRLIQNYHIKQIVSDIQKQFKGHQLKINSMITQFLKICTENKLPFQTNNDKLCGIRSCTDSQVEYLNFDQFYNKRIQYKVLIQQNKLKQLNDFRQNCKNDPLNVKKYVQKLQKQTIHQNENVLAQQCTIKFSFRKFKNHIQQQKVRQIFQQIQHVQNKFKKSCVNNRRSLQWSLQKRYKKIRQNQLYKTYIATQVINIDKIYQKVSKIIQKVKQIQRHDKIKQKLTNDNFQNKNNNVQNKRNTDIRKKVKIGPQIALRFRQFYFVLADYLFFTLKQNIINKQGQSIGIQFSFTLQKFNHNKQVIGNLINLMKEIFIKIQNQIKFYFKPLSIQTFESAKIWQLIQEFDIFVENQVMNSKIFTNRQKSFEKIWQIIMDPKYYIVLNKMRQQLKWIDDFYTNSDLQNQQILYINNVAINITQAKIKLKLKIRQFLIDVEVSYQNLYSNQIFAFDKMLRLAVEIKPQLLFQQNYNAVKNKYYTKLVKIQNIFGMLIQRRFVYLDHKSSTINILFEKSREKRQKMSDFIQNLQTRLSQYRKLMQRQISHIQNLNKKLKSTLKQLTINLKKLITDCKDQKDLLASSQTIINFSNEFDIYKREKAALIRRMQLNEITYWEDDDFFQKNISYLGLSIDFLKSQPYKVIFQSPIQQIEWPTFSQFFDLYKKLMNSIEQSKLTKIFKTNYDLIESNIQYIQVALYKGYTEQQLQKLQSYDIKVGKQFHSKLFTILKKVSNLDKKQHQDIINTFRKSKQNQFYEIKTSQLLQIQIVFVQIVQKHQSLGEFLLWRIQNLNQVYSSLNNLNNLKAQHFYNIVQKFACLCEQIDYLKKTLISLSGISQHQKVNIFQPLYYQYKQVLQQIQLEDKLNLDIIDLESFIGEIELKRQTYNQIFYKQKVRFFPRLGLLNTNTIIDCLYWDNPHQITKNIQSIFSDVDEVILLDGKIKKLKLNNDYITFQKQIDPHCMNGIQFLKFISVNVHGIVQDSLTQSINRPIHIKLINWHIYLTEQIQCAYLNKQSITQIKRRIKTIIQQISSELRYDISLHHRSVQINQLNLMVDFIQKLQKQQDPSKSYLWQSALKFSDRNKKLTVSQFNYDWQFGCQPKKAIPFQPQFQIQRSLRYNLSQTTQSYVLSANILGRPFMFLSIMKCILKSKLQKLLQIVYKLNFFVVVNHAILFQNHIIHHRIIDWNDKLFQQPIQQKKLSKIKKINEIKKINQFHKVLVYFQETRRDTQGQQQSKLPILITYANLAMIPVNFRSDIRVNANRSSRIMSLQLILLIQLSKFQSFFSIYNISLTKISNFLKQISDDFSMSFEKLNKIFQDFSLYINLISQQYERKSTYASGLLQISAQKLNLNDGVQKSNRNSNFKPINKQQKLKQSSQSSLQSSISQQSQQSQPQQIIIKKQKQFASQKNKTQYQVSLKKQQQKIKKKKLNTQFQDQRQKQIKIKSIQITKRINHQLFKILIHYYPQKQVQISRIMQFLIQNKDQIPIEQTLIQSIDSLRNGTGKNIIVYGQMSNKSTQIKKFLSYGKNTFPLIQDNHQSQSIIQIYYLEGLSSYYKLKSTHLNEDKSVHLKFILQIQSIHQITPSEIQQTLIYIHQLKGQTLKLMFKKRLFKIIQKTAYKYYYNFTLQNDLWIVIDNMHIIYLKANGQINLSVKMEIFFNIVQKELITTEQETSKKKIDAKFLFKQFIKIIFEIYFYSLDVVDRKIFIQESKNKIYFNFSQSKGLNFQDLSQYTTVYMQRQKIEQLIKKQKFNGKNIFPIQKQLALIRKYVHLQLRYTQKLLQKINYKSQNQKQLKFTPLKNINFIFLTSDYILNRSLMDYFRQQFNNQFQQVKKYLPNTKFIVNYIKKTIKSSKLSIKQKVKPQQLYIIDDLNLAIKQEQILIKILLDHYTQLSRNIMYSFFANKNDEKTKNILSYRPSLVFNIQNTNLQTIFKYQTKYGINENTVDRTNNLLKTGQFFKKSYNNVDFINFTMEYQLKLPAQIFEKFYLNTALLSRLTCYSDMQQELRMPRSQIQKISALDNMRSLQIFNYRLSRSIQILQNTLKIAYRPSIILKKKTITQMTQLEVQRVIQKFIEAYKDIIVNKYIKQTKDSNKQVKQNQVQFSKQQKMVEMSFLKKYLVRNNLKKYLHLALADKFYIIQEDVVLMPYLIGFIHSAKIFVFQEQNTFFCNFIQTIEKQCIKYVINDIFIKQQICIIIKPPLALCKKFEQFINLITKKVSFLQFYEQFQIFLSEQKQKSNFIFNSQSLYKKRISNFYDLIFNHCRFIISIKQCHASLFSMSQPDDKYKYSQQVKKVTKVFEKRTNDRHRTRLSRRDSLINRQMNQTKNISIPKQNLLFYQTKVSSVDKLTRQFWHNIVYLNISLSIEEKVKFAQEIAKYYFQKKYKQQQKYQQNKAVQSKQILNVLVQLINTILIKIFQKENIQIQIVDVFIKQIINFMFQIKKSSLMISSSNIENQITINDNIYEIKSQLQNSLQFYNQALKCKKQIQKQILIKTNQLRPKQLQTDILEKSIIFCLNSNKQQTEQQEQLNKLPSRKNKKHHFIHDNQKHISQLKNQFYQVHLDTLKQMVKIKQLSKLKQIAKIQQLINIKKNLISKQSQSQIKSQNKLNKQTNNKSDYLIKLNNIKQVSIRQSNTKQINTNQTNNQLKQINNQKKKLLHFKKMLQNIQSLKNQQLKGCFKFINGQAIPYDFRLNFVYALYKEKKKYAKVLDVVSKKKQKVLSYQQSILQIENKKINKVKKKTSDKFDKIDKMDKKQINLKSAQKMNAKITKQNSQNSQKEITQLSQYFQDKIKINQQNEQSQKINQKNMFIQLVDLAKLLYQSQQQYVDMFQNVTVFDVIFQRHLKVIVQLFQAYQLPNILAKDKKYLLANKISISIQNQKQQQNENINKQQVKRDKNSQIEQQSEEQKVEKDKTKNIIDMFMKDLKEIQYLFLLDILTLHKSYMEQYKQKLQKNQSNITTLHTYIQSCTQTNRQTKKRNQTTYKRLSRQQKQQVRIKQNTSSSKPILGLDIRIKIYQILFMNVLCNISQNNQLSDDIICCLQLEQSSQIMPPLKNLSKNKLNLSKSELIQIKTLEDKNKFIVVDLYNQFHQLVRNINSQCFFINHLNISLVNQLRFDIIFYCFYIESIQDFYHKKAIINQVQSLIKIKLLDSQGKNQKIVLLVSEKKLLEAMNLEENEYSSLNLQFTQIKFNQILQSKTQSLTRQDTSNLVQQYANVYGKLYNLSQRLNNIPSNQFQQVLSLLQTNNKQIMQRFYKLNKKLEQIFKDKNTREFSGSKFKMTFLYVQALLYDDCLPYRYFKRIVNKVKWQEIQDNIVNFYKKKRSKSYHQSSITSQQQSDISNQNLQNVNQNLQNVNQNLYNTNQNLYNTNQNLYNNNQNISISKQKKLIKEQIKQWLGKQLLSLKSQIFLEEFRQCLQFSNTIIIVYDILPKKIFKQIKVLAQLQKIDFKFWFQYPQLQKKNFLLDIDPQQLNQQQSKFDNKKLKRKASIDQLQSLRKIFTQCKVQIQAKQKNNYMDDEIICMEYNKKKNLYFVQDQQITKVHQLLHIGAMIWL